jgi:hypothetical protein
MSPASLPSSGLSRPGQTGREQRHNAQSPALRAQPSVTAERGRWRPIGARRGSYALSRP